MTQDVLEAMCLMWDASHHVAKREFVDAVEEALKVPYLIVIGEGESFEERIGATVRR